MVFVSRYLIFANLKRHHKLLLEHIIYVSRICRRKIWYYFYKCIRQFSYEFGTICSNLDSEKPVSRLRIFSLVEVLIGRNIYNFWPSMLLIVSVSHGLCQVYTQLATNFNVLNFECTIKISEQGFYLLLNKLSDNMYFWKKIFSSKDWGCYFSSQVGTESSVRFS